MDFKDGKNILLNLGLLRRKNSVNVVWRRLLASEMLGMRDKGDSTPSFAHYNSFCLSLDALGFQESSVLSIREISVATALLSPLS